MNRTTLMQRDNEFVHEVLTARDKLAQIASGETERGRRISQYNAEAGKRPLNSAWTGDAMAVRAYTRDTVNGLAEK
jgi:hypothetical protein